MGRTTKRRYDPQFKMRVALDVIRGDKTLSEVASENGIAPSLAAEWRDQLLSEGAADVFGKTKQERERGARGKPLPRSTTSCRGTSGSPPSSATSSAGLATSTATTRERSLAAAGGHAGVTRKRASEPLGVARSSTHYRHRGGSGTPSADDEHLMAEIDRIHLENPAYGARKIARQPSTGGERVTRHRATGLMRETNVRPCCPLPSLSRPSKASRRFPYLLGGKRMDFPDQVWSTDIAYVQIGGRHARLTAVIDWHGRCIVGWRLSDTMRAEEVVRCVEDAFREHGTPSVMNSDQGSVFGSDAYVGLLEGNHVTQSMDGRARWRGNVLTERRFRSLKPEWLRTHECSTPRGLERLVAEFVGYHNDRRIHQSLGCETPADWYYTGISRRVA